MNIATYFTGWITAKVLRTLIPLAVLFFLVYQCNRGCGRPETVQPHVFDYTAILTSLTPKDTIPLDTLSGTEDLKKIIPNEMIEFAKANSSQFARFLSKKYVLSNGYVESVDSLK